VVRIIMSEGFESGDYDPKKAPVIEVSSAGYTRRADPTPDAVERFRRALGRVVSEQPKIPHTFRSEPIIAYKRAAINVDPQGRWSFHGSMITEFYEKEDEAVCCHVGKRLLGTEVCTDPPVLDCTCGFYAVPEERLPTLLWGPGTRHSFFLLTVELSGRVIRHERAYRAQRQKVTKITAVLDTCEQCDTVAHVFSAARPWWSFSEPYVPGDLRMTCPHTGSGQYTLGDIAAAFEVPVDYQLRR
jgi:hypothetical protein